MENFDIEKLERKNIYDVPEDFFAKMQSNVLQQISASEQAPVYSIAPEKKKPAKRWIAAAVAAAISGMGIFVANSNDGQKDKYGTREPEYTQPVQNIDEEKIADNSDLIAENNNLNDDLTFDKSVNQKEDKATTATFADHRYQTAVAKKVSPAKAVKASYSTEAEADRIVSSLSQDELKDLAKNTENDVYLDLYY